MARTSFLKKRRGVNNHIQEGSRMVDALILAVIVLICVLTLYPMYYVFIMSISKPQDVMAMNVYLWPTGFELEAYKRFLPTATCGALMRIPSYTLRLPQY